jgi:hypothetical protein
MIHSEAKFLSSCVSVKPDKLSVSKIGIRDIPLLRGETGKQKVSTASQSEI